YDRALVAGPAASLRDWPFELLVWRAAEPGELAEQLDALIQALDAGARPLLADLARAVCDRSEQSGAAAAEKRASTLAIVVGSHDDLRAKLKQARAAIDEGKGEFDDPRGSPTQRGLYGPARRLPSFSPVRGRRRRICSASWPLRFPRS